MDNVGVHRCCGCSVRYTNPELSFESGLAAIESALAIIIDRVPALSSVVAFDDDTQTNVILRTACPRPEIELCDGIDLDLESSSYREWNAKTLDVPIDVRDPNRPPWRVFILKSGAEMSQGFDARVEFVFSHVTMDGLCGPFFHEILSELLSNPEHAYRTSRPVDSLSQVSMPSMSTIWDFNALVRLQGWSLARCLRPLAYMVRTAYQVLRQLWMPAKANPSSFSTVMRTISFNRDDMQRLLVQSRGHGVTLTNVMHACAAWAFASAQATALKRPFGDKHIPVKLATAMTLRPGYPGAQKLVPGIGFGLATRLDAIMPRNSAFQNLFLCAADGVESTVKVVPSLKFWDLCRDNRRLLTDTASKLQEIADETATQPALDWGYYQRRFLAATSTEWKKTGLSPRMLTGLEGHMIGQLTAKPKHPKHIITNSGMSQLSQGAGWIVEGLSWAANNNNTPYMITTVGSCASGMVLNTVYYPFRCSDKEAEVFVRVMKESMLAVANGKVPDEGTLGDLLSTE